MADPAAISSARTGESLGGASGPKFEVGQQRVHASNRRVWTAALGQPGTQHPAAGLQFAFPDHGQLFPQEQILGGEYAMRTHAKSNERDQVAQKGSNRSWKIHDGQHHAISDMEVRRIGNCDSNSNGPEFLRRTTVKFSPAAMWSARI